MRIPHPDIWIPYLSICILEALLANILSSNQKIFVLYSALEDGKKFNKINA